MHWLHQIWFGYFVPSLWGNGPEALVQTAVYGSIAYLCVPPVRRWVNGHVHALHMRALHVEDAVRNAHNDHVALAQQHHQEVMEQAERHHAEHLAAIRASKPPARKAPAAKKTPAPRSAK